MRIGQLTDCYLPVLNGVTNLVRTHKAQLQRLGHQSPVFTVGHRDYADEEADIVRSWGIPLGDTGYFAAAAYSREAQAHLATMDVLHAHHPFVAGQLALRYGRHFGRPIVYTNHTRLDLYAGTYAPSPLSRLAQRMVYWYMPRFASRCDLVIAPSDGLAAVMRGRWGVTVPVEVVPNGIDLARFRRSAGARVRTKLGLPADGTLAIYTGRLGLEKNLGFLLRAFARVAASEPELHLLLLGGGPQAEALKAMVAELGLGERVILPGAVAYEQVPDYLSAADLFVSASVTEVHPMSLIEALAAGLPAVGMMSPGVADTIEDGVNGLLAAGHLTSFAEALGRVATDAAFRARLAEGALRSGARYGIERTTEQTVELYRRLLNGRAGKRIE